MQRRQFLRFGEDLFELPMDTCRGRLRLSCVTYKRYIALSHRCARYQDGSINARCEKRKARGSGITAAPPALCRHASAAQTATHAVRTAPPFCAFNSRLLNVICATSCEICIAARSLAAHSNRAYACNGTALRRRFRAQNATRNAYETTGATRCAWRTRSGAYRAAFASSHAGALTPHKSATAAHRQ